MRSLALASLALVLPAALTAHPHASVDQQAHLSIGLNETIVALYLVPSATDGEHMFDHIDANADRLLSNAEQSTFGNALLGGARLSLDGRAVTLTVSSITIPERGTISRGNGLIIVRARGKFRLPVRAGQRLSFDMKYQRFAKEWSVQPFYLPDFAKIVGRPRVNRSASLNRITLSL